jgi:hypothetical protein
MFYIQRAFSGVGWVGGGNPVNFGALTSPRLIGGERYGGVQCGIPEIYKNNYL